LAIVQMCWGNPFGLTPLVFPCGPAFFGEFVVGAAGQCEVIDVGGVAGGVGGEVVDFAVIAGHITVGEGTSTIFGMKVQVVRPSGLLGWTVPRSLDQLCAPGQYTLMASNKNGRTCGPVRP
jgi:hypothetical protein